MPDVEVVPIEVQSLVTATEERIVSPLVRRAHEIEVVDAESYEEGGLFVLHVARKRKLAELEFDGTEDKPGPVKLAHRSWKSMLGLRDKVLDAIDEARAIVDAKCLAWKAEDDRKRRAEEERQRIEAKRKADAEAAERARLMRVEADKQEAEARKRREEEQVRAAKLREDGNKQAAKEAEQRSKDAERKALEESEERRREADAVVTRAAATPAPPVVLASTVPEVKGYTPRKGTWGAYRVIDEKLIPEHYWMRVLNEKMLKATVASMKDRTNIPGIEAIPPGDISAARTS